MRENFAFASNEKYVPKPFKMLWNQNTSGKYDDVYFTSTMTTLTLKQGSIECTVGVKNPKDFNFDALYKIALPEFKRLIKNKERSDDREFKISFKKEKKERKRPQY